MSFFVIEYYFYGLTWLIVYWFIYISFFSEKSIDLKSVNLKKLKVRDLKKILSDWDEECEDCLEKGDFIRKIEDLKPKYLKSELWEICVLGFFCLKTRDRF